MLALASTTSAVQRADLLARLARQALIAEVNLTPKPGLVDLRGSGAHADLSLELMHQSARMIEPYLMQMALISIDQSPSQSLFSEVNLIGRQAERAMFHATGGVNTHKGAIWSLGLLVVGAAMQPQSKTSARGIASSAMRMAFFQRDLVAPVSHGKIVQQQFEVLGARGETQLGFPHVIEVGMPILKRRRYEGANDTVARLDCLLGIMSELDDTCLLYRGGMTGLNAAQSGAKAVLRAGGMNTSLGRRKYLELDSALLELGCSPGGSADLLAATIFVDALEHNVTDVCVNSQDTGGIKWKF